VSRFELEPFSDLEGRRELWSELALASRNIFATPEWASAWWRHYASESALPRFSECRSQGRPFAILPLYSSKRAGARVLRFTGHGPGDVLGPVCAEADTGAAGAALVQELAERPQGWRVFVAERMPCGPLGRALGGTRVQTEANPYLDTEGKDWQSYMASRSKNMRQQMGRRARKLEKAHTVAYRLTEDPERLDADMEAMMRLHAARWGEPGAFAGPAAAFHKDFARSALDAGWLRLWTMEVDGEAVAAWYGFRYAGIEFFYQSGRNPRWDDWSVGYLLLVQTMRSAFDEGMERYAFLRGDEPYKHRFASGDHGLETRARGRGRAGSAAAAAGIALMGRVPALRARLVGELE
jgi:CelD/BcsL family acetyltransferase involved in cellulose biosynthesis